MAHLLARPHLLRASLSSATADVACQGWIAHPKPVGHEFLRLALPRSIHAGKPALSCQVGEETRNQMLVKEMEEDHVPLLSTTEVITRLQNIVLGSTHQEAYRAMYSSVVGGIITDPSMMLIPIDDHMVHRGHGVFDTALILDGYLYELDAHLDRLLKSASMAKITPPFSRSILRDILVATAAASNCREGSLRYWLSAGPGGFKLSSRQCKRASFYAIVVEEEHTPSEEGVTVTTSTIPMKPPEFATMKNVNYLPNALSMMEAEEKGAFAGIWLDDEGFVAEGPNMNVAFVNQAGVLLMPAFDRVLSGCTAKRTLALAHKLLAEKEVDTAALLPTAEISQQVGLLKGIKVGQISVEEAKSAAEMMLIGSGLPIVPVIEWDQQPIGNGQPGPITLALLALVREDMLCGPTTHREPVPYKDQQLERH